MNQKSKHIPLSMPKGILFDTDNTLYAYEPAHKNGMYAVKAKALQLFSISNSEFDDAFSVARAEVKDQLGSVASSHSRLLYFQRLLEKLGLGSQVLLALDFEQTYWSAFLAASNLFDGVKDVLERARLLGVPTAIVTDLTAQIQFRKIIYFELDQYFDYVVTSEEAGHDKPNAAPFLLALEKMALKPGPDIWMVGDSLENDIVGAKDAIQATTFQKVHDGVMESSGRDCGTYKFREFRELHHILMSTSDVNDS